MEQDKSLGDDNGENCSQLHLHKIACFVEAIVRQTSNSLSRHGTVTYNGLLHVNYPRLQTFDVGSQPAYLQDGTGMTPLLHDFLEGITMFH